MANPPGTTPRVLISAPEPSGDLYAAALSRALIARGIRPLVSAGPLTAAVPGTTLVASPATRAVMGYGEVVAHLFTLRRLLAHLVRTVTYQQPAAAVLIDAAGFHLPLARALAPLGVRAYSFIPPKTWASRPGRLPDIARLFHKVFTIFPWEPRHFEDAGVKTCHVGHPLPAMMDRVLGRAPARAVVRRKGAFRIALLPGSREFEIANLLPVLARAARRILAVHPRTHFVLLRADAVSPDRFENVATEFGIPVTVVSNERARDLALENCDLALAASGTATLEIGLLGVPMVVVYRVGAVSALVARATLSVRFISLPNLILDREVVPELLQGRATPGVVARVALDLLADPEKRFRMAADLATLRSHLAGPSGAGFDPIDLVANEIVADAA